MHFQLPEGSGGPTTGPTEDVKKVSSTLPFGQPVALSSISGPTYVTAQLLVQQVAYKLSDKIFSYSPDTFDLDVAAKGWAAGHEKNVHGYATSVLPLQTRTGAGTFALGYIFSPDFDMTKRHVPQTVLAPTASLRQLRGALDQLSLLYGVASPFVAHVAAADYSSDAGLVAEYDTALRLADEVGLGLVASFSAYESQHMALLATLMAALVPTLHVYDGIRMPRETLRVVDALGEQGLAETYANLSKAVATTLLTSPRLDNSGKVMELFRLFNDELGTAYDLFEYSGHEQAETVMVVFGSAECQLAYQVVNQLAGQGAKVGVVKVRVYRPFVEEEFIKALPGSAKKVLVLGQVASEAAVGDGGVQSALFNDVLAAITFSRPLAAKPKVEELKYSPAQSLTPGFFFAAIGKTDGVSTEGNEIQSLDQAQQYTFWDVDDSATANTPSAVASIFSRESSNNNVFVYEMNDNLTQGGIVRTDIRSSKKTTEAPYQVEESDVTVIGDEKLLKGINVLSSVKQGGNVIIRLPNFKSEEVDKRLPVDFRNSAKEKDAGVFVLDTAQSPAFEHDPVVTKLLIELAFLVVARPDITLEDISKIALYQGNATILAECFNALGECFKKLEIPETWAEVPEDYKKPELRASIATNSFVGFEKQAKEPDLQLDDWKSAAKGFIFREAYGTRTSLRPDVAVKTATITVKENRRLTPESYSRNIFHIEFDLGDSGLTYNIGEALGIHGENDAEQVREFISFYGLDPEALVPVPAREDEASQVETRTVFQALSQNLDILGKPPKRFYEALAEFATDEKERGKLAALGGPEGADEFKHRSEEDTATYADILEEFPSARPGFHDLARIVSPLKRREYSIASAQAVTPTSVALMIVVVDWVDTKGRTRYGHASRYLSQLPVGTRVTASVKPSVMKLPALDTAPLIMAGLGTGLAPFRAFVQYRAMQKAAGKEIGDILLYMGSRHQREEYLYGEEWEAYVDAGVITLLGAAFSRDQPQKVYIQDRMRQTMDSIVKTYVRGAGSFYLCGPTWPVPDVTEVLMEAIAEAGRGATKKVDPRKEIERLKEDGRYVLEVY